jgi:hypothetical protein
MADKYLDDEYKKDKKQDKDFYIWWGNYDHILYKSSNKC